MSQNQDKFIARLPDGMRDRLKKVAEQNSRSMNAELVEALKAYLDSEEPKLPGVAQPTGSQSEAPATKADIDMLLKRLDEISASKEPKG